MSMAPPNARSRKRSASIVCALFLHENGGAFVGFLVLLLGFPRPAHSVTAAPSSRSAFPETKACAQLQNDGKRALCELLAALEGVTPDSNKRDGSVDHGPPNNSKRSRFKDEGGPTLHRYATEPTLELENVLRAYTGMHAACTSLERENLTIASREPQLQCKYLIWSCTFGLGNQLMSLVSAFLLSIFSQRVLLLDNPTWDQLFMEPFVGSSWLAPPGFTFRDVQSPTMTELRALRCGSKRVTSDARCETNMVSVVFTMATAIEDQQLLVCPSSILSLRNITFLNLGNSNQHFAAGFFLNPGLRPLLEILFPQRNVFHALSRFLLIPSDAVWERILSHDQLVMNATRRIGVQLRESKGDYRHYFDDVVPLCIKSKVGSCWMEWTEPTGDQQFTGPDSPPSGEDFVSIYVSSLVGGHFTKLQESLHRLETETGQRFVLLSQPSDGEQIDDVEHQQKALVDIWILSLSDILLTTHMSTFGYTAHALAGITPYHLKHWLDNPCQLSLSNDPCYHFAPKKVSCPAEDPFLVVQDSLLEVPYVKACPDIPETGLQLQEP